jgi:hypothetical protein
MSTATMAQAGALHLSRTSQRATRKHYAALPERMGKSPLLGPLQALVEARMRKAQIEMEFRPHSCGEASTGAGKAQVTYFAELCSQVASRLSSLVRGLTNLGHLPSGNAPAPRASALPAALRLPLRAAPPQRVDALSRLDLAPGSPAEDQPPRYTSSIGLCAQGDILIERVDDVPTPRSETDAVDAKVVILARGELSGHRHRIHGHITLFHASELARDLPKGLYVGHLHVKTGSARLEHEEHDAITLQKGTYRVRRQRRLEPSDTDVVED